MAMYKTYFKPVLTYASKTWTKETLQKIISTRTASKKGKLGKVKL